ncbi:MAG: sigma-54-dependent Fis family transcriptional regulator [Candidatus Rokubacteria bacterium]|nr:sigma-54-dependent Fis family transcriptional regulator [Candidatus Rokubacteria bacterium]
MRPATAPVERRRPRLLVADDDADLRALLGEALDGWGYETGLAAGGAEAVELARRQLFDAALLDINMPGMDGLRLLEALKRHDPAIDVVMMTGDPAVSTAVQALKAGAWDYLVKPLNLDELQHLLRRLLEKRLLSREVSDLRSRLGEHLAAKELVSASPAMARVKALVEKVAESDSPVLIEGESGTGKELVASAIHRRSARATGPFVPVNCGAIPDDLMESEFFGHVRGAFTGAVADALGLFRSAHGGSLFLDEVAELPPALQAKLLRVLQDQEIRPVGSTKTYSVDVRIIAATNKDLEAAVKSGGFRPDLFYRLNVVRVVLPPLRERREEIPALVTHFLRQLNQRFRRDVRGVAPDALAALAAYDFPGNVRELENLLERAYALGARAELTRADLPGLTPAMPAPAAAAAPVAAGAGDSFPTLEQAERELVAAALRCFGTDKERAARALGLTLRTLYRRIKKHGLD